MQTSSETRNVPAGSSHETAPIRVNGNPFNEFIVSRTPASRWGDPEDLAGAAVFLASADSDMMTGQVLVVDGGQIMLG